MGYIYKITNKINQKSYIGKTENSISNRWQEHLKYFRKTKKHTRVLYMAFAKYGIENFSIEEIERCDNSILSDREIYWIEKFDTFKNGYNMTKGGDGSSYIDYDLVMSLWNDGKCIKEIQQETFYCAESIAKILSEKNISIRERKNRGYKKATEKKIQNHYQGKTVEMIDKNTNEVLKTFQTVREALRFLGKSSSGGGNIPAACKNPSRTAYGYKWRYS